jgi:autotransporter passenger strand-loop-strand repeat protein
MSIDVEIFNGQTYNVSSGQTDTGDLVDLGGTLAVLLDGTISNTTDYGTVNVSSGGTASGTVVYNGSVNVFSGGTISNTLDEGSVYVSSGGSAVGTTIDGGGIEYIYDDGTVTNTTIVDGSQQVNSSVRTTNTMIFGGSQQVNSGGVAVDTTIDDLQGGTVVQRVDAGGTASGAIRNNGGSQAVGGAALGTTINAGGMQIVQLGGTALGATVNSGGDQRIAAGGFPTMPLSPAARSPGVLLVLTFRAFLLSAR